MNGAAPARTAPVAIAASRGGAHENALQFFAEATSTAQREPVLPHQQQQQQQLQTPPSRFSAFAHQATPMVGLSTSLPSGSPSALGSSVGAQFPPYTASLFGAPLADDEHVTVWEPATGKTVAGNAAPYRRNLAQWLAAHPGWEEKADELKSSKRRSAARRAKAAAAAFAALCQNAPVAARLTAEIEERVTQLTRLSGNREVVDAGDSDWSSEEYVRLEEALSRLGEELMALTEADFNLQWSQSDAQGSARWTAIAAIVSTSKTELEVLRRGLAILSRAIEHTARLPGSAADGERSRGTAFPVSLRGGAAGGGAMIPTELPSLSLPPASVSFLERSFRAPREPRITVWEPSTGRTVSGNAAPCRRNLEQWIAQHPGWEPKQDEHLSSSRRARNRKSGLSAASSANNTPAFGPQKSPPAEAPFTPALSAALEGLLLMHNSPALAPAQPPATLDDDADVLADVSMLMAPPDASNLAPSGSGGVGSSQAADSSTMSEESLGAQSAGSGEARRAGLAAPIPNDGDSFDSRAVKRRLAMSVSPRRSSLLSDDCEINAAVGGEENNMQ